jgi:hypothetical protein
VSDVGNVKADWSTHLDQAVASSRSTRHRLVVFASLIPDIILGILDAVLGGGGYVPAGQLRRSMWRTRRRLARGKAVKVDVWWTDTRLPPEHATVQVRTDRAILRRRFQPEADLAAEYQPAEFLGAPLPSNLAGSDMTWLTLNGRAGTRYLGANDIDLALIGLCAGWPYPSSTTSQ